MVVTSPPNNLGIAYRTYDDGRPRADYLEWTGSIAIEREAASGRAGLTDDLAVATTSPSTRPGS